MQKLNKPVFAHGDAVDITGIADKTLNNWANCGIIKASAMHNSDRRYSVFDLIELSIVKELVERVQMHRMQAGIAAATAANYARVYFSEVALKANKKAPRYYLTTCFENGKYKVALQFGDNWLVKGNTPFHSIQHPFIVIPLNDIVLRVTSKCAEVLEREVRRQDPKREYSPEGRKLSSNGRVRPVGELPRGAAPWDKTACGSTSSSPHMQTPQISNRGNAPLFKMENEK